MASIAASSTVFAGRSERAKRAPAERPRLLVSCVCTSAGVGDGPVVALDDDLAARLDLETCSPPEAARRLRTWVSATQPTLFLLRDGEIAAMAVGALSRREVERLIRHALM